MQLMPRDRVSANSNAYFGGVSFKHARSPPLLIFHAISGKSVNEGSDNLEI